MAASRHLHLTRISTTLFRNISVIRSNCKSVTCRNYHRTVTKSTEITYRKYGDPRQVLESNTVDVSNSVQPNEVLVKMLMAPVNPSDINMVEGTYFIRPSLPAFVGNEGVGEVVNKGSDVSALEIGDRVIPRDSGFGTWRSYAVSRVSDLMKIAKDIQPLAGATISVNPCSAYRMLKDYVTLQPGDYIIQNGANSSVGQCVIQLARQWGIKTINIVRNRTEIEDLKTYLKSIGADHVITEEFCRTPEMKPLLKSLRNAPKLALNCVGGKSSTELLRCLAPGGTMVTYGGMSKQPVIIPTGTLIFKEIRLVGYWNTQWNKNNVDNAERNNMFLDLCDLIRSNKLLPPKCQFVPISQFQKAVTTAMEGFKSEKQILVMDESLL
ncbi:enoyl-[acyl-carrier-protein] reductase, mitochondrial-like [Gigantopelta aegis]|uniref:enoyl-[acyl-carrier-protein] reductase, mitochondrial-like n=1 Tax=Gigantopelta aegis TaxID=1735272 RepID=UPI001B88D152|nr:enoyl-[acyl-carrier-protein] reductase, mitochondrial-like [Gigantopelta aegis]